VLSSSPCVFAVFSSEEGAGSPASLAFKLELPSGSEALVLLGNWSELGFFGSELELGVVEFEVWSFWLWLWLCLSWDWAWAESAAVEEEAEVEAGSCILSPKQEIPRPLTRYSSTKNE